MFSSNNNSEIDIDSTYTKYGECRCCTARGQHRDLEKEYYYNNIKEVYREIFKECFNLSLLPHNLISSLICESCVKRLRDASSFRMMAAASEELQLNTVIFKSDPENDTEDAPQNFTTEVKIENDLLIINMIPSPEPEVFPDELENSTENEQVNDDNGRTNDDVPLNDNNRTNDYELVNDIEQTNVDVPLNDNDRTNHDFPLNDKERTNDEGYVNDKKRINNYELFNDIEQTNVDVLLNDIERTNNDVPLQDKERTNDERCVNENERLNAYEPMNDNEQTNFEVPMNDKERTNNDDPLIEKERTNDEGCVNDKERMNVRLNDKERTKDKVPVHDQERTNDYVPLHDKEQTNQEGCVNKNEGISDDVRVNQKERVSVEQRMNDNDVWSDGSNDPINVDDYAWSDVFDDPINDDVLLNDKERMNGYDGWSDVSEDPMNDDMRVTDNERTNEDVLLNDKERVYDNDGSSDVFDDLVNDDADWSTDTDNELVIDENRDTSGTDEILSDEDLDMCGSIFSSTITRSETSSADDEPCAMVEGEKTLLSKFTPVRPLPKRRALTKICPKFNEHLKRLQYKTIEPKSIQRFFKIKRSETRVTKTTLSDKQAVEASTPIKPVEPKTILSVKQALVESIPEKIIEPKSIERVSKTISSTKKTTKIKETKITDRQALAVDATTLFKFSNTTALKTKNGNGSPCIYCRKHNKYNRLKERQKDKRPTIEPKSRKRASKARTRKTKTILSDKQTLAESIPGKIVETKSMERVTKTKTLGLKEKNNTDRQALAEDATSLFKFSNATASKTKNKIVYACFYCQKVYKNNRLKQNDKHHIKKSKLKERVSKRKTPKRKETKTKLSDNEALESSIPKIPKTILSIPDNIVKPKSMEQISEPKTPKTGETHINLSDKTAFKLSITEKLVATKTIFLRNLDLVESIQDKLIEPKSIERVAQLKTLKTKKTHTNLSDHHVLQPSIPKRPITILSDYKVLVAPIPDKLIKPKSIERVSETKTIETQTNLSDKQALEPSIPKKTITILSDYKVLVAPIPDKLSEPKSIERVSKTTTPKIKETNTKLPDKEALKPSIPGKLVDPKSLFILSYNQALEEPIPKKIKTILSDKQVQATFIADKRIEPKSIERVSKTNTPRKKETKKKLSDSRAREGPISKKSKTILSDRQVLVKSIQDKLIEPKSVEWVSKTTTPKIKETNTKLPDKEALKPSIPGKLVDPKSLFILSYNQALEVPIPKKKKTILSDTQVQATFIADKRMEPKSIERVSKTNKPRKKETKKKLSDSRALEGPISKKSKTILSDRQVLVKSIQDKLIEPKSVEWVSKTMTPRTKETKTKLSDNQALEAPIPKKTKIILSDKQDLVKSIQDKLIKPKSIEQVSESKTPNAKGTQSSLSDKKAFDLSIPEKLVATKTIFLRNLDLVKSIQDKLIEPKSIERVAQPKTLKTKVTHTNLSDHHVLQPSIPKRPITIFSDNQVQAASIPYKLIEPKSIERVSETKTIETQTNLSDKQALEPSIPKKTITILSDYKVMVAPIPDKLSEPKSIERVSKTTTPKIKETNTKFSDKEALKPSIPGKLVDPKSLFILSYNQALEEPIPKKIKTILSDKQVQATFIADKRIEPKSIKRVSKTNTPRKKETKKKLSDSRALEGPISKKSKTVLSDRQVLVKSIQDKLIEPKSVEWVSKTKTPRTKETKTKLSDNQALEAPIPKKTKIILSDKQDLVKCIQDELIEPKSIEQVSESKTPNAKGTQSSLSDKKDFELSIPEKLVATNTIFSNNQDLVKSIQDKRIERKSIKWVSEPKALKTKETQTNLSDKQALEPSIPKKLVVPKSLPILSYNQALEGPIPKKTKAISSNSQDLVKSIQDKLIEPKLIECISNTNTPKTKLSDKEALEPFTPKGPTTILSDKQATATSIADKLIEPKSIERVSKTNTPRIKESKTMLSDKQDIVASIPDKLIEPKSMEWLSKTKTPKTKLSDKEALELSTSKRPKTMLLDEKDLVASIPDKLIELKSMERVAEPKALKTKETHTNLSDKEALETSTPENLVATKAIFSDHQALVKSIPDKIIEPKSIKGVSEPKELKTKETQTILSYKSALEPSIPKRPITILSDYQVLVAYIPYKQIEPKSIERVSEPKELKTKETQTNLLDRQALEPSIKKKTITILSDYKVLVAPIPDKQIEPKSIEWVSKTMTPKIKETNTKLSHKEALTLSTPKIPKIILTDNQVLATSIADKRSEPKSIERVSKTNTSRTKETKIKLSDNRALEAPIPKKTILSDKQALLGSFQDKLTKPISTERVSKTKKHKRRESKTNLSDKQALAASIPDNIVEPKSLERVSETKTVLQPSNPRKPKRMWLEKQALEQSVPDEPIKPKSIQRVPKKNIGPKAKNIADRHALAVDATTLFEFSNATAFTIKNRNSYSCFYCREVYSCNRLKEHQEEKHQKSSIYTLLAKFYVDAFVIYAEITNLKCILCKNDIKDLNELRAHLTTKHAKTMHKTPDRVIPFKLQEKDFECQICGRMFETFGSVEKHMNTHFGTYMCETCGTQFITKHRLAVHNYSSHRNDKIVCKVCNKSFATHLKLRIHYEGVHEKNKTVKCTQCPEKFIDHCAKLKHLADVHGEEIQIYECSECEKQFARRGGLNDHMKRCHMPEIKERKVKCDKCSFTCYTKSELRDHSVKHGGAEAFECDICKRVYNRRRALVMHVKIHKYDNS